MKLLPSRRLALFFLVVLASAIAPNAAEEVTVNLISDAAEGEDTANPAAATASSISDPLSSSNGDASKAPAANTAMHRAAIRGDAAGVAAAIADGADLDSFYPTFGATALMLAAGRNDAASLALLVDAGADLELQEAKHGWTALFLAANRGHAEAVQLLIAAGAAWDLRDKSDLWTPFMTAVYGGHEGAAQTLLAAGDAEQAAAQLGATDDGDNTPLMRAIAQGVTNTDMVAWLIEAGSPLEATQKGGQTALMLAARAGRDDVISLLTKAGAAVDSVGSSKIGRTALHHAVAGYEFGAPKRTARLVATVRVLLAAGADPRVQDKIRQTAADTARERLERTRPEKESAGEEPPLFGQLIALLEGAAGDRDEQPQKGAAGSGDEL